MGRERGVGRGYILQRVVACDGRKHALVWSTLPCEFGLTAIGKIFYGAIGGQMRRHEAANCIAAHTEAGPFSRPVFLSFATLQLAFNHSFVLRVLPLHLARVPIFALVLRPACIDVTRSCHNYKGPTIVCPSKT